MTKIVLKKVAMEKLILLFAVLLFVGLEFSAINMDSHYKYDLIMCIFLTVALFLARKVLHLYWFHYLLFNVFLIFHNLGMYQYYDRYPLGIEYDYWIHGFFGLVSSLIIMRAFVFSSEKLHLRTCMLLTIVFVLGISAAHELYEFAGAMLLGEGEGVLFIGAGDLDEWDTQKDMLNNLIGSIVGLFAYFIHRSV